MVVRGFSKQRVLSSSWLRYFQKPWNCKKNPKGQMSQKEREELWTVLLCVLEHAHDIVSAPPQTSRLSRPTSFISALENLLLSRIWQNSNRQVSLGLMTHCSLVMIMLPTSWAFKEYFLKNYSNIQEDYFNFITWTQGLNSLQQDSGGLWLPLG